MKKIFYTITFLLLITLLANAQWQPDVRLTNASGSSWVAGNGEGLKANGNVVHVVWYDDRDGNNEIYYKRSTDGGTTWGTDTRLTNNSFESNGSSLLVSGSVVHVVWNDNRDGNDEIYYKRSTDGGTTWGADTRLTNYPGVSQGAEILESGSLLHLIWSDRRDGNDEIYYKRSTDGGTTWGADTRLTNASGISLYLDVSISGSTLHVVWADSRDGNNEIYYKRSTDAGVTWDADMRMTNNNGDSEEPAVSVSGQVVHLVWYDDFEGNNEIYYKRSTDGGTTWGANTRLTNNPSASTTPDIEVSGSIVNIVWADSRTGNYEIYYKQSTDGGINWGTDTRLTTANTNNQSKHPQITTSGSAIHVVWCDNRDGNLEIYYKKNPTGNPTVVGYWPFSGNTADSSGMGNNGTIVGNVTLTTDRCGNPNSAYLFNGGKITINSANGFPIGNGPRTMCAWFKRNAVNTGTAHYILSVGGNSYDGCRSSIDIDNVNTWVGVENRWPANYKVWQPDTNWHFLCAVFPQGSTICGDYKVYFDGVLGHDTSRLANTPLNTNTEAPAIGCLGSANVYNFYGKIDEVRLYNTALNDSQISQLYGAPAAPILNSPANNSSDISLTPLLDWAITPFAANYRVQLSTDSVFAATQLDTIVNADSVRVPAGRLLNNLKYYWRVRASACVTNGLYSAIFNFTTSLISINQIGNQIPKEFMLFSNYPNPFNPTTKIRFDVPKQDFVTIKIFDVLGREVATLVNEQLKPGTYEVDFDGSSYTSGVYFYKLLTDGYTETKKMILVK